jgi:hypothetical protein
MRTVEAVTAGAVVASEFDGVTLVVGGDGNTGDVAATGTGLAPIP